MPYIDWDDMKDWQRDQIRAVYGASDDLYRFAFWQTKAGRMSRKKGHHELSKRGNAEVDAMLKGTSVRTKGDLRDWKPGTTFHFSRG